MKSITIGLDISDYSIELVSLVRSGGGVSIGACSRMELPEGIVKRGVIVNRAKLVVALRQLVTEAYGPNHGHVSAGVSLPESQVYAKLFRLPPGLDASMAIQAAALEAQRLFPMPVATAVQSATVVEKKPDYQEVFFAAVDRNLAIQYEATLEEAGISCLFFDSESMAIARALVDLKETEAVLIADIGAKATLLSLYDQGRLKAGFSLNAGGDRLTQSLVAKLGLPTPEAEALKRGSGLNPAAKDGRAMLVLQQPVADIITEIRRTLDYATQLLGHPVTKIVLAGGTSLVPGLAEYVALNFSDLAVTRGEPFRNVNTASLIKADEVKKKSVLFATAAGLALRAAGLRAVPGLDLLPRERRLTAGESLLDYARRFGASLRSMVNKDKKPVKAKAVKGKGAAAATSIVKPVVPTVPAASERVEPILSVFDQEGAAPSVATEPPTAVPEMPVKAEPVAVTLPAKSKKKPGGKGAQALVPAAEEAPTAKEPLMAEPPRPVLPVEPAAPEPTEAAVAEALTVPAAAEAPIMAEAVQLEAKAEEPEAVDYGQGVGDLLDEDFRPDVSAIQPTLVQAEDRGVDDGQGHLSIDAILAGKRLPKKPMKEPEQEEKPEPVAPEEEKKPSVLPLMIIVILLVAATAVGVFFFARKSGLDISKFWPKAAPASEPAAVPE
ncbi:MAG: pilus assembly protein PilM, partial [Patescibacteria group bacterium]|nr:pilus assembly protein PilM [Patescibacteria group bacterium]